MLLQLYFVALLRLAELASSLHAKFLIDINARLVFINTGQTRPYRQGVLATPLWTSNFRTTWEFSRRVQHASKHFSFLPLSKFQIFLLTFSFQLLYFDILYFDICIRDFPFRRQTFSRQTFRDKTCILRCHIPAILSSTLRVKGCVVE